MIFMTWTPAIRETQHHKPNTHAGTQTVNAIPSTPAHSTYKHKKKYRQCKNLLWRSVKSSLDFSPSLCHLSSNPYNQLNGKEISMSSFHATEDQVWHFNLEALAGHTQNNALVRKTNLSPCYKNKQPQWKLFFVYIHFCLNQKSVLLVFTWMALLCREKPAFNVPSNRPIESVLRSKGVTSVTYFAPDQGFSRPIAHSSVSPPTPSKTTSNLEVEKETDNLVNILLEMW